MCDDSIKELQSVATTVRANGRVATAMLDLVRPVKTYLDHFSKAEKPSQQLEDAVDRGLACYHYVRSVRAPVIPAVARFSLKRYTLELKAACVSNLQGAEKDQYLRKKGRSKIEWLLWYANKHPELWFD